MDRFRGLFLCLTFLSGWFPLFLKRMSGKKNGKVKNICCSSCGDDSSFRIKKVNHKRFPVLHSFISLSLTTFVQEIPLDNDKRGK